MATKKEIKYTVVKYECADCGKWRYMVARGHRKLCLDCYIEKELTAFHELTGLVIMLKEYPKGET